jgi:O-antigen ligase
VALVVAAVLFLRLRACSVGAACGSCWRLGRRVVAVAWFVPAFGMQARFDEGVSDVRTWVDGGNVGTRVGTRLELWKGAPC